MYWDQNLTTAGVLKTGGSSEAELSWEGSNNVALRSSCSTTSLVLLVFDTQLSNSRLHIFALRRLCLLPASGCGRTGVTTHYSSISVHTEAIYMTASILHVQERTPLRRATYTLFLPTHHDIQPYNLQAYAIGHSFVTVHWFGQLHVQLLCELSDV